MADNWEVTSEALTFREGRIHVQCAPCGGDGWEPFATAEIRAGSLSTPVVVWRRRKPDEGPAVPEGIDRMQAILAANRTLQGEVDDLHQKLAHAELRLRSQDSLIADMRKIVKSRQKPQA